MDNYTRVIDTFRRVNCGGAFVPVTDTESIDRLKKDGYQIRVIPGAGVVKVLNPVFWEHK